MSIHVKYFASLREWLGRDEDEISIEVVSGNNSSTVEDIWNYVSKDRAMPANMLCAINLEYVQLDTSVKDEDEVAFFPPVTGG